MCRIGGNQGHVKMFPSISIISGLLLLMVASEISSDLSKRIKHYETLSSSDLSHTIVKRGLDPGGSHKFNKIREVGFRTLGRDFRLILSPKKGLLHHNFKAVEIDENDNQTREFIIPIDHESFYEGRVFGEIKSSATVHLEDGVLTAKIETPQDTYHIEPSWRHLKSQHHHQKADEKNPPTMIAYKESDVIEKQENNDHHQHLPHLPKTCGYVKEGLVDEESEDLELEQFNNRTKRQTTGELFLDLRQTRCPLLLVADYR